MEIGPKEQEAKLTNMLYTLELCKTELIAKYGQNSERDAPTACEILCDEADVIVLAKGIACRNQ